MPNYETLRDETRLAPLAPLRADPGGHDRSATRDDATHRRLGLRMPGRIIGRPDSPALPEGFAPAAARAGTPELPATANGAATQGRPRSGTAHKRTPGLSRGKRARAASPAAPAPEGMLPAQVDQHAAFLDHEHAVAASFARARTDEPGLTCNEWSRRNPFTPATRRTPADPVA